MQFKNTQAPHTEAAADSSTSTGTATDNTTSDDNVIDLLARRKPGAALRELDGRLPPADDYLILPDMSHANGRDVVDMIADALSQ